MTDDTILNPVPQIDGLREPLLGCYRCAHIWTPRSSVVRICPRCKSRLWDLPRVRDPQRAVRGLGLEEVVGQHGPALRRLARAHHASDPRVFGSVARGEATDSSDIDIVVRFDARATLLEHIRLRRSIRDLLDRPVDLVDETAIHWYSKPQIMSEAVKL